MSKNVGKNTGQAIISIAEAHGSSPVYIPSPIKYSTGNFGNISFKIPFKTNKIKQTTKYTIEIIIII
jgi:hypothetical protein